MVDKIKIRIWLLIEGRVQGVFFRDYTKKIADLFNLTGWVRNLLDGRVEIVFEGEKDAIEGAIQEIKKGPPLARVDNVEIKWLPYQGEFNSFKILY